MPPYERATRQSVVCKVRITGRNVLLADKWAHLERGLGQLSLFSYNEMRASPCKNWCWLLRPILFLFFFLCLCLSSVFCCFCLLFSINSLHSQLAERNAHLRAPRLNEGNNEEPRDPEWPSVPVFSRTDLSQAKQLARDLTGNIAQEQIETTPHAGNKGQSRVTFRETTKI